MFLDIQISSNSAIFKALMRSDIVLNRIFVGAIFTQVIHVKCNSTWGFSDLSFGDFLEILLYELRLFELKNYFSWKIVWVEKLYESKLNELKWYESILFEMLLSIPPLFYNNI